MSRRSIRCSFTRSGLVLALLAVLLTGETPTVRAEETVYITVGPEAPSILRVLIGENRVITAQPGRLADALHDELTRRNSSVLILPEDWASGGDLETAHAAGLRIVTIQRHTSILHIEQNIRLLAALTGTESIGAQWLTSIDQGLAEIRAATDVRGEHKPRVLALSPEAYTQGQGSLLTNLINTAGGVNVAAEAGIPEAREVEDDQIRQFAPDVVLLIDWKPEAAVVFAHSPVYRGIPAFERYRLYRIAAPGKDPARLVADVRQLAALIHWQEF